MYIAWTEIKINQKTRSVCIHKPNNDHTAN